MFHKRLLFCVIPLLLCADRGAAQTCCPCFSLCVRIDCPPGPIQPGALLPLCITVCNHSCCPFCYKNSEYRFCVYDECCCPVPDALIINPILRDIHVPACGCVVDKVTLRMNMNVLKDGHCYTLVVCLRGQQSCVRFTPCRHHGPGHHELPPPKEATERPNDAAIIVTLPPNARLIVNDLPSKVTTRMQKLEIPNLEPGISYPYVLQCEVGRGSQRQLVTREVAIGAGQTRHVDFTRDEHTMASKPTDTATIMVSLPRNAKLTVDGAAMDTVAGSRSFVVTGIRDGEPYTCELHCALEQDGAVLTARRRLNVTAGATLRVDFNPLLEETASRR